MQDIIQPGAAVQHVDIPRFSASSFNAFMGPVEFAFVVNQLSPAVANGEIGPALKPAVLLTMSPQTAKELMALLQDGVAEHERQAGEIRTPWLTERAEQAKKR